MRTDAATGGVWGSWRTGVRSAAQRLFQIHLQIPNSSTPTLSRTSASLMPSCSRRATGIEACVITAGWLTRLSTPPSDSARVNSSVFSQKRRLEPTLEYDRDDAAVAGHLLAGQLMLRVRGQAGVDHLLHRRVLSSHCASASALAQCAFMRSGRVFRPRRARKLSNGPCTPPPSSAGTPSARPVRRCRQPPPCRRPCPSDR